MGNGVALGRGHNGATFVKNFSDIKNKGSSLSRLSAPSPTSALQPCWKNPGIENEHTGACFCFVEVTFGD